MTADLLRSAAALMRERAEAATSSPWRVVSQANAKIVGNTETVASGSTGIADCWGRPASWRKPDAEHIASWHPAVALAVADWLEVEAMAVDALRAAAVDRQFDPEWVERETTKRHGPALAVARAYLGDGA